jgi:hypothetical protein
MLRCCSIPFFYWWAGWHGQCGAWGCLLFSFLMTTGGDMAWGACLMMDWLAGWLYDARIWEASVQLGG